PARGIENGLAFEELSSHADVALKAACREDDAAPREYVALASIAAHAHAMNFPRLGICDQPLNRRGKPNLNALLDKIVMQDLEQFRAIGRAVRPGIRLPRIEPRNLFDRRVIECLGPRQGVVSRI